MKKLSESSTLTFRRVRYSRTDDKLNTTFLRYATDSGLVLPNTDTAMLEALMRGQTLGKAARDNKKSMREVRALVKVLVEAGYVRKIDGWQVGERTGKIKPWLAYIPQKYFLWALSPGIVVPGLLLIAIGLIIGIWRPEYFPDLTDFFWHPNLFVAIVGIFTLNYFLIFLHEWAHYAATRAVGGQAKMLFDYQATSVVVATEVYHLALLPKYAKFITYLSGLFLDLVLTAGAMIAFYLEGQGSLQLGIWREILQMAVLLQLNAMVWEFGTFLTTDVYYFVTDLLGEEDLKESSRQYLSRKATNLNDPLRKLARKIWKRGEVGVSVKKENSWKYWSYLAASSLGYLSTLTTRLAITLPKYLLFCWFALVQLMGAVRAGEWQLGILAILTLLLVNEHGFSLAYMLKRDKKI